MNATKKNEILQTLAATNDDSLIEEVYRLIHPEYQVEQINVEALPLDLQGKIQNALEDYKAGRYITQEQMKQKVDQWLTK